MSQSPIVLACDASIADELGEILKLRSKRNLSKSSFANFNNQLAWQEETVVILAVGSRNDLEHAARFVVEARMRRSPLRIALVCLGSNTEAPASLSPHIACNTTWPDGIDRLVELIVSTPLTVTTKLTVADSLANRLKLTTPSLLSHVTRLAVAAAHDVTVLLSGETGTGKTYLARMLHEHSPRRECPFLMVPCGAQPSNLFESTFFGHVKGAYTGAHQARKGRFAAAGKGTILLDEVDALGLEQQASLLRVIETGEYELVGGNETFHNESRIIVACNTDLEKEVAKGTFRQDLFYRLNVMSIHLRPLRQRRQDIPLLVRDIVARLNTKFGKELFDISDDAMDALVSCDWPGNIRQLENVLQEAVLLSSGPELSLADLPNLPQVADKTGITDPVLANGAQQNLNHDNNGHAQKAGETLSNGRADFERGLIHRTLNDCRQNRSQAARILGVSRVTLYKKLKQYGLPDSEIQ